PKDTRTRLVKEHNTLRHNIPGCHTGLIVEHRHQSLNVGGGRDAREEDVVVGEDDEDEDDVDVDELNEISGWNAALATADWEGDDANGDDAMDLDEGEAHSGDVQAEEAHIGQPGPTASEICGQVLNQRWGLGCRVDDQSESSASDEESEDQSQDATEWPESSDTELDSLDERDDISINGEADDSNSEEKAPTEAELADAYFRLQYARAAAKSMKLDEVDAAVTRRYIFKVEGHLSERLFNQLPQVYPDTPHESLKRTKKHIESLSGFNSVRYDCCVDSCVCFTGTFKDLDKCPGQNGLRPCRMCNIRGINRSNNAPDPPADDEAPRKRRDHTLYVPLSRTCVFNEMERASAETDKGESEREESESEDAEDGEESGQSEGEEEDEDEAGDESDEERMDEDLTKEGTIMTAEMHTNWAMFIAPIVLYGRLHPVYYKHFMDLHRLIELCTAVEMEADSLKEIEKGFQRWVQDYEELYYEKDPARLSACPLTIHALLHIADGIRACGPVWAYWAYPMERHCNTLLPAIRSRRHPFAAIAAFVTAMAHLHQIRLKYNAIKSLQLDPPKSETGFKPMEYPHYKLTSPKHEIFATDTLRRKIWAHLATVFKKSVGTIRESFPLEDKIQKYGRIVKLELDGDDVDEGDVMLGADMHTGMEDSRDATYVRYDCEIDLAAHRPRDDEVMDMQTFYGRLKYVLVVDLPPAPALNLPASQHVMAIIAQAQMQVHDNIEFFTALHADEIVDLSTVKCVVGRVAYNRGWAIVDRNDRVDFTG
ncbi:hypothetical protein CVT24_006665, partial [Panaeolus cyanescens]